MKQVLIQSGLGNLTIYSTYPADTQLSTLKTMAGGAALKKIMWSDRELNLNLTEHSLKTLPEAQRTQGIEFKT